MSDQDSEVEVSEGTEDEFFSSIFNLDGVHHSESRNSGISADAVLYGSKMLNFRWKWTPEQQHLSSAMQITNGISNT